MSDLDKYQANQMHIKDVYKTISTVKVDFIMITTGAAILILGWSYSHGSLEK